MSADTAFWKQKLAAFLHDPPSKALDIAGHWEVARSAYFAAGFSQEEVSRYEKSADHTAAAADRLPFPNHQASGLRCHFDGQRNAFRHPLCGEKLPFKAFESAELAERGNQMVQPVIQNFGDLQEGEQWRARHFAHWRLWREKAQETDWRLGYLPADTRIPDHSIWHHMSVVAALAGCREGDKPGLRPAFLKVQIGPVQDMIAAARSVRDLWSGSYLLSWLMAAGLKALTAEIGPDAVIFPSLYQQPLFDLHWRQDLWGKVSIGNSTVWDSWKYRHKDQLLVPGLPNVFLAIVPVGRSAELGKLVERAIREEWGRIAEASWNYCDAANLPDKKTHLTADEGDHFSREERKARFFQQTAQFPQISWHAEPWPDDLASALALANKTFPEDMPVRKSAEVVGNIVNMAQKHMPKDHRDQRYYADQGKTVLNNIGVAWSVILQHANWKLDAVRQTREFKAWAEGGWSRGAFQNKDSLTGREEAVAGGEEWVSRCAALKGSWASLFKKSDWLSALTLVKRVWHLAYLAKEPWGLKTSLSEFKMPNTHGVARGEPLSSDADEADPEDLPASEKYFAVLALDGDEIGKWVSGERTPKLGEVLAEYQDGSSKVDQGVAPYFRRPEFKEFLEGHRPLSPGFHLQFSETLANFSQHAVWPIVDHFKGRLIYAGGDDVLAMLPARTALDCAAALRTAFQGGSVDLAGLSAKANGYLVSERFRQATGHVLPGEEESIPFPVPGPKADVSVGIAMAHFMSPLQDVVRAAQAAEKRAKTELDRGAIAVSLFKRSGEILHWGCKWDSGGLALFTGMLQAMLEPGELLSGKFPHRVCELLEPYLTSRTGISKQSEVSEFDSKGIIRLEFAHALERQAKPPIRAELTQLLDEYLEKLKTSENESLHQTRLRAVIGLCRAVAFAGRTSTGK